MSVKFDGVASFWSRIFLALRCSPRAPYHAVKLTVAVAPTKL
jgi:hypothetical protein